MADGEDPGAQGGDAPNVVSFQKAQRRREDKEKRRLAHEKKLGKGDETRQFGCEMRPNDKKPGLYSISEDGGWIAQLLNVLGRGRAPAERGGVPGMRGIVIAFKNCNGHEREVFLNNALLNGDVGKLTTVLSELGFSLDHGDGARKALKRYLAGYVHSKRIIVSPRTGWLWDRGCRVAFVLPDEVIGTPDADDRIILDPNYKSAKMEQRGTFEEWQKDAPRLARKHTLARFRMSAAFAGPLLGPSGEEGGVFNLYGESSGGKSAIDYLAMSVLGRGHRYDGYGQTWSVTANGAEGTFGSHNDLVLFMDDTSTAEPRDISKVIYVSASSQGKTRMTGEISTRRPPPFRLIIMSSGEKSNIDLLKENKLRVTPGFMVRAPDIPAMGKGKTSTIGAGAAFDASDEDWNAWVAEAAKVSVAAYGTALPEFVRRFIDAGIKDDEVRGLIDKFVAARGLTDPHGQVRRVARKFGLIATAGELAIKLGVLPWDKGDTLEAAVYAFELWLSRRGTSGSLDLKQALERIRDLFEKSSEARFDVVPLSGDMVEFQRPPAPNRLGWTRGNCDDRRWHMLPGTFQKEICAGFDEPTLISVLVKKGVLEELDPERGGRPKKARLWPGFRPRCFSFTSKVFQVAQDDADETDDD